MSAECEGHGALIGTPRDRLRMLLVRDMWLTAFRRAKQPALLVNEMRTGFRSLR